MAVRIGINGFGRIGRLFLRAALETPDLHVVGLDGNPHSAIVNAPSTAVIDGTLVKALAWCDDEWGQSCRVRDLVRHLARSL
jgi:glyceraldehyde 3-phosphate dehydrogenase